MTPLSDVRGENAPLRTVACVLTAILVLISGVSLMLVYLPVSTSADTPVGVSSVTCSPACFSPNGDGILDTTTINVSATTGQTLYASIYSNGTGEWINAVALDEVGSTGYYEGVWNGENHTGATVDDGLYDIYASTSSDGNRSNLSSLYAQVTVDTTPPEIVWIDIINNETGARYYLTSDSDYTIIAAIVDNGSGLNYSSAEIDGPFNGAPIKASAWNGTHVYWYVHTTTLADAQPQEIKIYAEDTAGNAIIPSWGQWASDKYKWLHAIGDDSPPVLANDTYNSHYRRQGIPPRWENISARVLDPPQWSNTYAYTLPWNFTFFGVNYTTIYVDLFGYIAVGTSYASDQSPTWSEFVSRRMISPMWHYFMADAYDASANDMPDGALGVYLENLSNPDRVVVRWYVNDAYDPLNYAEFEAVLYADGTVEFDYGNIDMNITKWGAIAGISNGTGEVYGTCWSPNSTVRFIPSENPPSGTMVDYGASNAAYNGGTMNVSAVVMDNISWVTAVDIVLWNGSTYPTSSQDDMYWAVIPVNGLEDGEYTYGISMTDAVGNTITEANVSNFTVDNYHDLAVSTIGPFLDGGYYVPGIYNITVIVSNKGTDDEGGYTVNAELSNASGVVYSNTTTPGVINISQDIQVVFQGLNLSGEGEYTLNISVSLSGDENTSNDMLSISFVVDGTAPDVTNMDVSTGPYSAWVNFTTDEDTLCTLVYGIDGNMGTYTETGYGTVHNISIGNLSSAVEYTYYLVCIDRAGNTLIYNNSGQGYSFTTVDVIPPVIYDMVTLVSGDTAVISWRTDEPSDAAVYYGPSADNISLMAMNTTLGLNHSVVLRNLSSDTVYLYYVESTDVHNNTARADNNGMYYTLIVSDYLPPETTSMSIYPFPNGTAVAINITTDEPCMLSIKYWGLTRGDAYWANSTIFATMHNISIYGLLPDTEYDFTAYLSDEYGNTVTLGTEGNPLTFTTYDTVPPVISAIAVTVEVDDGSICAIVEWDTDENANATVYYGTDSAGLLNETGFTAGEATMALHHTVRIDGLEAQETYYFYVSSTDGNGNTAVDYNGSSLYTFDTPDITPIEVLSKIPVADEVYISEGDILNLTIEVGGTEDNPVVYTWLINGFFIKEGNESTLVFAPTYVQAGVYVIEVIAEEISSPPSTVKARWTIHVSDILPPPEIRGYYPPEHNIQIYENQSVVFGVTPTIAYGEWRVSWYLDGMAMLDNTTERNYTYIADFNSAGEHHICAVVMGNGMSTAVNWYVEVVNVNRLPVVSYVSPGISDISVHAGDGIRFQASAEDPDGDGVVYLWYVDSDGAIVSKDGIYIFENISAGVHSVTLYVSDGLGSPVAVRKWNITAAQEENGGIISSFSFNPSTVGKGDRVVFSIVYTDMGNTLPESVMLVINGDPYPMEEADAQDNDATDGKMYLVAVRLNGVVESLEVKYRVNGEVRTYIPDSVPDVVEGSTTSSKSGGTQDNLWYAVVLILVSIIIIQAILRRNAGGKRSTPDESTIDGEAVLSGLIENAEAIGKEDMADGGDVEGGTSDDDEEDDTYGDGKEYTCLSCGYQFNIQKLREEGGKKIIEEVRMCGYYDRELKDITPCEHFGRYEELRKGSYDIDVHTTCIQCRNFQYEFKIDPETKEVSRIPMCNLTGKPVVLRNLQVCGEFAPLDAGEDEDY